MTDWKPGDLCQVKRGKRWVDAEVLIAVPGWVRVRLGDSRLLSVGYADLRPRPAKRGKLPEPMCGVNGPAAEAFVPIAEPVPLTQEAVAEARRVGAATDERGPVPILTKPVPKPKTARSKDYLAHVRTFPCCSCGREEGIHAHHVASGGMGAKCSDYLTAPLCGPCHSHWHATAVLPTMGYGYLEGVAALGVMWAAAAKCLAAWVERDRR